jgi:hypothetical protein
LSTQTPAHVTKPAGHPHAPLTHACPMLLLVQTLS